MENKSIIQVDPELVRKADHAQELGELIKPLTRDIHLFDSFIAGTSYLKDPGILQKAVIGDTLTLRRERDNRFDDNAIMILNGNGEKYGYIPEKDNMVIARLMDAGKLIAAKIKNIQAKGSFTMISIGIYLTDF